MENQNAYAPSAEAGFEDVLEIPDPLRAAPHASEQSLVLEDVIPVHELSATDEWIEQPLDGADATESAFTPLEEDERTMPVAPVASLHENDWLKRPEALAAAQSSSFDYEGNRAWLRVAPMLLLVAVMVFLALYYLGNRVGSRGKSENAAASPAQTEPQSVVATEAAAPAKVESEPEASQPVAATSTTTTDTVSSSSSSGPVAAEGATHTQPENRKAEPVKNESRPAATATTTTEAAPAPAQAAASVAAPADQATGNYTVQIGSYNNAAQADERVGRLRASGVEARVVRVEIPRRGTWYRVQSGRFASHEEAARHASALKGKGAADDFIITQSQ
ncbi:MAG TPA: SPOR domain-containing protein [Pyrinomonadaceae bacterium]|jgi:cell division protein FtsN|nr:SPOR domain-containing protein [Pyrinomonadaceae bacterium]